MTASTHQKFFSTGPRNSSTRIHTVFKKKVYAAAAADE
jgi:hypothetical protein